MPISSQVQERFESAARGLARATAGVTDSFMQNQILLAGNMLIDAANAFLLRQSARRYRDLQFAFQDLEGIASELGPASAPFDEPIDTIRGLVSELDEYGLSGELASRIDQLVEKLQEQIRAYDKQAFLPPGSEADPLPHPPESLSGDAAAIREEVVAEEFDAPMLEKLANQPQEFEMRDYAVLSDELTAITQ